MSKSIANVDINADNFEGWVTKTNQALHFISTEAINANTTTGSTTGNAQLNGIIS